MKKIKKISRILSFLLMITLVLIPIFEVWNWVFIEQDVFFPVLQQIGISMTHTEVLYKLDRNITWNFLSKTIGVISGIIEIIPIWFSCLFLMMLFKNYVKEQIFTVKNAKLYRSLGILFLVNAFITKPLSGMLLSLAVSINNAPGHRNISLSFGSDNLGSILLAIIIMVISWVMLEGARLNEESQLTV